MKVCFSVFTTVFNRAVILLGFYNRPGNPSYPYQGSDGIDFDANLAISTIDFGTAHVSNLRPQPSGVADWDQLYPVAWQQTSDTVGWGSQCELTRLWTAASH
jgi:hypothetical protein